MRIAFRFRLSLRSGTLFPQVVYSADIRPAATDIPGLWNPAGVSGIPVVYCFPVSAFYYSYDLYDLL